jgi:hypothetical protein
MEIIHYNLEKPFASIVQNVPAVVLSPLLACSAGLAHSCKTYGVERSMEKSKHIYVALYRKINDISR